jgi:hypothetical protein
LYNDPSTNTSDYSVNAKNLLVQIYANTELVGECERDPNIDYEFNCGINGLNGNIIRVSLQPTETTRKLGGCHFGVLTPEWSNCENAKFDSDSILPEFYIDLKSLVVGSETNVTEVVLMTGDSVSFEIVDIQ